MSKQTITAITDRVMEGLAEWQSRPLDPVYAVIFIDAINVKIREGQHVGADAGSGAVPDGADVQVVRSAESPLDVGQVP